MIYNGFRRIALAHSLLPARLGARDGHEAGDGDENIPEQSVPDQPVTRQAPTALPQS